MHVSKDGQKVLPWEDPAFVADPYPWYDRARRDYPVYRDTDGTYVFTRYEDIARIGKLPSLSIVEPPSPGPMPWAALGQTVLAMDPPRHTQSRRRVNRWFTPKMVQSWVRSAEDTAHVVLDGIRDGEVFDANLHLGVGPTHAAMCAALQFPPDDFAPVIGSMHKTMAALSAVATPKANEEATDAFDYLLARVMAMVAKKRAEPGDGMADALIAQCDAGELTEAEMLQTLMLFWASGGHNPSYLVSSGIRVFAEKPEIFALYKEDETKRLSIINELIRLYPPELSFSRYATESIFVHDITIVPGERVKFILDSANRDPAVFQDADVFDPERPANAVQNVSFGMGPHACAGQVISRAEGKAIFDVFAQRVAEFRLAGTPVRDNTDRSRAYVDLPITIKKY